MTIFTNYFKDGKDIIDSCFQIKLKDYWENWKTVHATLRFSVGQWLFLMEIIDKMKLPTANKIGSRIASVHHGASLFTGDAVSGESIITYFIREVEPHVTEAWINLDSVKIDCELLFNKYFYQHTPLRSLEAITKYLWALDKQGEGLAEILNV